MNDLSEKLFSNEDSRPPDGPLVPRVAAWYENPVFNDQGGKELLNWVRMNTPLEVTRTPEDRLPNGLASGMMSVLVDWEASRPDNRENGFYIVHNVIIGGSPVIGQLIHATVRIPTRAILRIEYIVVKTALTGKDKERGHGQLRFVFDPNNRPEILGSEAKNILKDPFLDDLIMSWEAWRNPLIKWTIETGLDPENYTLTARLSAGHQRFTNDSLRKKFWHCYPLALPDVEDAADTLLHTTLLMGDSLMRRVIGEMIDFEELEADELPDGIHWTAEDVAEARKALDWKEIPDEEAKARFNDADISYQLFERSCISMSMTEVDLAMERIHAMHNLGPRKRVNTCPDSFPPLFDSIIKGDRLSMIAGLPEGLAWYWKHQTILPSKSHELLEKAGLLQQDEKGQTISYIYDIDRVMPYGKLGHNLMM